MNNLHVINLYSSSSIYPNSVDKALKPASIHWMPSLWMTGQHEVAPNNSLVSRYISSLHHKVHNFGRTIQFPTLQSTDLACTVLPVLVLLEIVHGRSCWRTLILQPCTAGWERWLAYGDGPRALDRRRARAVVLVPELSPDNAIALGHSVKISMHVLRRSMHASTCGWVFLSSPFKFLS
jgi:hypothetical protein